MRVLMLSRDSSGLNSKSSTAERWRLLRDNGADLKVLIMSRSIGRSDESGISVISFGGSNILSRLCRLYFSVKYEIRNTKYDLITAQDPFELGLVAYLTSKKFKKKFELQDHGGFFDGEKADEPLWFLRSRLAKWLARRADRIRTVSPKSFEKLKSVGLGQKTYWLPIPAGQRFGGLVHKSEFGLIVSVGRLVSVKRFDLLLAAFVLVKKDIPQSKLVIIGEGPLKKRLIKKTQTLGLRSSVIFAGQSDPAPWLERAAVFVLLSSHEGWGIAAIEAALAGVPVVMSDTGCAGWLKEKGSAMVVDQRSSSAALIASRLKEVILGQIKLNKLVNQPMKIEQFLKFQVARWAELC